MSGGVKAGVLEEAKKKWDANSDKLRKEVDGSKSSLADAEKEGKGLESDLDEAERELKKLQQAEKDARDKKTKAAVEKSERDAKIRETKRGADEINSKTAETDRALEAARKELAALKELFAFAK